MPPTDNQGSSSPFRSFGFSIFSPRREHVHPTGAVNPESDARALDFESFQKQIAERFHELAAVDNDDLLSIEWIMKLLDAFIYCQEEFRVLLNDKIQVVKSPLDHLADEYFERSIKALDICNATRDGIEKIRMWQKHLEIVLCAFDSSQRGLGEGQIRRARKALMDLALAMLEEKVSGSVSSHRNRSFGRHNASKDRHGRPPGHARSLSWSVSRNWSASKQLQAIANNLVPPKGNELAISNGLALPFFTMNCVLTFVLWTLVAAIPCQDRSVNVHFSFPRHYVWAAPLLSLHERITEESKKREHKNSNGLLKEGRETEKCVRNLTDLVDLLQFPISDEQRNEVVECVKDLGVVCEALRKGLDPLERQVRDVFRTIMSFRTEGLAMARDTE